RPLPLRAAPRLRGLPVPLRRQRRGAGLLAGGPDRPAPVLHRAAAHRPRGPPPARAAGGLRRLRRGGAIPPVSGRVVTGRVPGTRRELASARAPPSGARRP